MTIRRTPAQAYLQVLQEPSEATSIRMAAQKKPAPRRISGGCLLYEMNFKRATREATKKPGPTDVCYAHQTHQEYAEQAAYIEANCEAIMDSIRATVATEELMGKLRKGGAL